MAFSWGQMGATLLSQQLQAQLPLNAMLRLQMYQQICTLI